VFDRDTGKSKGFGFCEYTDTASAESAIRNLNGREVCADAGRPSCGQGVPAAHGRATVQYRNRKLRVDLATEKSGPEGMGGGAPPTRMGPITVPTPNLGPTGPSGVDTRGAPPPKRVS
jgi:cleavage stimulation factor subunit 2